MPTMQLVKSMERPLTDEEAKGIVEWWAQHPDLTEAEVIAHWERELKMPITHHAVLEAMMEHGTLD